MLDLYLWRMSFESMQHPDLMHLFLSKCDYSQFKISDLILILPVSPIVYKRSAKIS